MAKFNLRKKHILLVALLVLTVLLATGCFAERAVAPEKPAGFFMGIWHGWIAPIALIVGLFNKTTMIYEVNNTGWWYDFGYYMAIISGFGGLSVSRHSRKKSRDKD